MVGNKRGEIRKEVILRIIMLLLSALVLFPFLYCVAYSLSDSVAVMTTQITIFPVQPTFKNYIEVLNQRNIFNSFFISIFRDHEISFSPFRVKPPGNVIAACSTFPHFVINSLLVTCSPSLLIQHRSICGIQIP